MNCGKGDAAIQSFCQTASCHLRVVAQHLWLLELRVGPTFHSTLLRSMACFNYMISRNRSSIVELCSKLQGCPWVVRPLLECPRPPLRSGLRHHPGAAAQPPTFASR